jgi:hypothetical protein
MGMRELALLQREIEQVRRSLHDLVITKKEDFADSEVSRLSIHLDHLILQYQKLRAINEKTGK